jgi:hypothetical protein
MTDLQSTLQTLTIIKQFPKDTNRSATPREFMVATANFLKVKAVSFMQSQQQLLPFIFSKGQKKF